MNATFTEIIPARREETGGRGTGQMTGADLDTLDQLGPVLCRFGARTVNLSWASPIAPALGFPADPGSYWVDWRDERGRFYSGAGATPSLAVEAALARADRPAGFTGVATPRQAAA